MPTPETLVGRIRIKPDALDLMAEAIGPGAYRPDGKPRQAILLGKATGTASKQLAGLHPASATTFATASARYAQAAGIGLWDAAQRLFDFDIAGAAGTEDAAA